MEKFSEQRRFFEFDTEFFDLGSIFAEVAGTNPKFSTEQCGTLLKMQNTTSSIFSLESKRGKLQSEPQ